MKIESVKNKIVSLGGTAEITIEEKEGINGRYNNIKLSGTLGSYDIEFDGAENRYFTTRKSNDRNHFDAGSDYNPFGFCFHYKIKQLEQLI